MFPLLFIPTTFFRYGATSIRGSLFLPGRSPVQIPGLEGAGSDTAGAVRGSTGVPVGC